ncbi:MAG: cobalt transporter [Nitrososphaeraceae archaeon]|nr:cobalt transporter [Nitrososphaeraceae archaeon]
MSQSRFLLKNISKAPKSLILGLILVFVLGIFVIGYDQGHIFSIVQGDTAYGNLWMHEFTHDLRHAAGFPCH